MPYQNFYELNVWKCVRQLKLKVYPVLKRFLPDEKYELTSQLRRAVRSVAANISEGHGRRTSRDELQFCVIARGSLSETLNHLIDAYDCAYITRENLADFKRYWDELRKYLVGYMSFLKSKLSGSNAQQANSTVEETEVIYEQLRDITEKEETLEEFFRHLETQIPVRVEGFAD